MSIWVWIGLYGTAALLLLLAAFGGGYYGGKTRQSGPPFAAFTAFKILACAALGLFAGGTLSPATDGPARFALLVLLPVALIGAALLSGLVFLLATWLVRVAPPRSPRRDLPLAALTNAAAVAAGLLLGYLVYISG